MRFDFDKPKTYPKDLSTRSVYGYLFFPKLIGSELRWLELARWTERFHATKRGVNNLGYVENPYNKWKAFQWENP